MSDACATCDGQCCYNVIVPVTGYDAWRIKRAQALDFEHFLVAAPPGRVAGGTFLIGDAPHALFLAKSRAAPRACTFLMHLPGEVRRCGIYPERPRVCAVYPMTIRNGAVDLRDDVVCKASNWNMATLTYPKWRAALLGHFFEGLLNDRVAGVWNRTVPASARALEGYYAYLEAAFEAIDDLRRSLDAEAYDAMMLHWQDPGQAPAEGARAAAFIAAAEERAAALL